MGNFLSSSRHKGLELFSWKIRIQKPENVVFASISQITGFTNQWPWPYGPTALWPSLKREIIVISYMLITKEEG